MPKPWISVSEEQNILEGFGLRSGIDLIAQHLLPQSPSECTACRKPLNVAKFWENPIEINE
jgi:hypothetical protein